MVNIEAAARADRPAVEPAAKRLVDHPALGEDARTDPLAFPRQREEEVLAPHVGAVSLPGFAPAELQHLLDARGGGQGIAGTAGVGSAQEPLDSAAIPTSEEILLLAGVVLAAV